MSEPTVLTGDLDHELRRYFAVTTSTELPRRVRELSARTLVTRHRPRPVALLSAAGGVLATAALLVLIATHLGSSATTSGGSSAALSLGAGAKAQPGSFAPALIAYPGVDTGRLAGSGPALLLPAGHGSARVGSAQATVAAVTSVGSLAEAPGPAVLAFAVFDGSQRGACLCWVVEVPVRGGVVAGTSFAAPLRAELVLVDAVNGRIVTSLIGNGIP